MIEISRDDFLELQYDRKEAARFDAQLRRIEQIMDRHALMSTKELHDKVIGVIRGWICTKHGQERCRECREAGA